VYQCVINCVPCVINCVPMCYLTHGADIRTMLCYCL